MKIAYEHLIENIENKPEINEVSERLFQLGHEHEIEDDIFDIEFTPNRGDCLSLRGLLRDLNLFYNTEISNEVFKGKINKLDLDFVNNSTEHCKSISFLKIEIDEVPKNYKNNLKKYFDILEVKKNNFFTDVSNYLSYETGQPTHCYDTDKLGNYIKLDTLKEHYEFETLLDKKINLDGENLVFTRKNNEVINLAGVIGGKNTACDSSTRSIILECAHFNPEVIMGKAVKYNLTSEAAHKFERNTDPFCHDYVVRRFIKIIEDHAKIFNMELYTQCHRSQEKYSLKLNVRHINQILGTNISENECILYLEKLGFEIKDSIIYIPNHRHDIRNNNDISEEVARAIGYDNIKAQNINISSKNKTNIVTENEIKLKNILINNGFSEVINNPFVSYSNDISIVVDNPLDSNKKYLRTNLKNSLIQNLIYNERRQKDIIKLFEVSDIYNNSNSFKKVIGIIASGRVDNNFQDFTKKIDSEYIKNILSNSINKIDDINFEEISRVKINSKSKNMITYAEFEINSNVEINYDEDFKDKKFLDIQYQPVSEFPCSIRDLSFSVKDYSRYEPLKEYIFNFKDDILKDVFIFDYFLNEKNNEIKIGFRFIFQDSNSTITEIQVNNIMNVIINHTIKDKSVTIPGL
jgi:phenylalanyl-tRNA synthetase beta chain